MPGKKPSYDPNSFENTINNRKLFFEKIFLKKIPKYCELLIISKQLPDKIPSGDKSTSFVPIEKQFSAFPSREKTTS